MDVLADILASLRLTGGVVIDAEAHGDFCFESQFTPDDWAGYLNSRTADMMAYHYVRSGRVFAKVDGAPAIEAVAGDVILLPRNDHHLVYSRHEIAPVDSHSLVQASADGPARIVIEGTGEEISLYCGFLGVSTEHHSLLDSLPAILKLGGDCGAHDEWMASSLRLLNEGRQSPEVVARLAELFFAEAIRRYLDDLPDGEGGWLAGLRDPPVARALAVIHARYAEDLDIEALAHEVGLSRSALGERFVALLGEPPMRYCAHWRMRMAANMLRDGKQNNANIAYAVGFNSEAAFTRAFKREYGEPPATWRRNRIERRAGVVSPPDDVVRHGIAADGTALAYAISGDGFPLVKAPNWITHLDLDRSSPVYRHWICEAERSSRLVRFDMRGFGRSDWEPAEFSFAAMTEDIGAVADAAGVEQFDLLGISHGAAIAIAFAAHYPERVRKLVLVNPFAQGWRVRADPEEVAWRTSLIEMNRREWSFRRSLLGEMFIALYFPHAGEELIAWHNEHFEELGPVPNLERMIEVAADIDIGNELARVRAPTLVCHSRQDGNAPLNAGRAVAGGIAGARFIELDSANHILLGDEPAWPIFTGEFRRFLKAG